MGLDSVEIVMKVEQAFGIKIPDRQAEKILTVGDFHDVVWQHIQDRPGDKCKTQMLFYKLRKAFEVAFNFPAQQLKLDTSPEVVFPTTNRRKEYFRLAEETNLQFPDVGLRAPWSLVLTYFGVITILGGLATAIIINRFYDNGWLYFIPVLGFVATMWLSSILNPKRTVISERTMRQFVNHTMSLNYSTFRTTEGVNRKEVEMVINQIIADHSGNELADVDPEKKIGDDLGID